MFAFSVFILITFFAVDCFNIKAVNGQVISSDKVISSGKCTYDKAKAT